MRLKRFCRTFILHPFIHQILQLLLCQSKKFAHLSSILWYLLFLFLTSPFHMGWRLGRYYRSYNLCKEFLKVDCFSVNVLISYANVLMCWCTDRPFRDHLFTVEIKEWWYNSFWSSGFAILFKIECIIFFVSLSSNSIHMSWSWILFPISFWKVIFGCTFKNNPIECSLCELNFLCDKKVLLLTSVLKKFDMQYLDPYLSSPNGLQIQFRGIRILLSCHFPCKYP